MEEKVEEKPIHSRIDFEVGDPLNQKTRAIKDELGLKHFSEVLRVLVKGYVLKKGGN